MRKYLRSIKKEKEIEKEAIEEGKIVYRIAGGGPYSLVTIDRLNRQVTFIEVRAHPGKNFRVDRDVRSYPEFGMMTRRITYDGVVDK